MNKNNKISYYSIEDIDKIGVVDNINCNAKGFLSIFAKILPFLLILAITNIMPISIWISNIVFIVISIITFIILFSMRVYNRFINFNFSIKDKEIIYKNEDGQIFKYREENLLSAKLHHRYSYSWVFSYKIEMIMNEFFE